MAGVVASRSCQAHARVDVAELARLPLLLGGDLDVLRAAVDGEQDVLAVTRANHDRVAVDRLHRSGDPDAADANPSRVELAVLVVIPNDDVAADLDLGPGSLLAILHDHGFIS